MGHERHRHRSCSYEFQRWYTVLIQYDDNCIALRYKGVDEEAASSDVESMETGPPDGKGSGD